MKKKINILINEEARFLGLYYGYWNWFFLFEKDLKELDLEVNFYSVINKKFLEADYLFLNSRSLPKNNDFIDIAYLKKLYSKNSNLYWFDMRDSAGTTQFEVLPYVKKYIKKQLYKDKTLYSKKIEGGRFYSDYYIKNYNIRDTQDYNSELINPIYLNKLILGWNLGVSFFFDSIKFSKMEYYKEFLKKKFFYNKNYSMILDDFENWDDDGKKFDFISLMNTNIYRNSVAYQRKNLQKILINYDNKNKIINNRYSKRDYYKTLRNSKVSVGAYGWGEVCYREFEAIKCGVAFMTADMSNIETWPNIYHKNETYQPYDLDFKNFLDDLKNLINNVNLRKKFVHNSKQILYDCHSLKGKNYFLNKINEIIS